MADSVTQLLRRLREGDPDAQAELTPLVYAELHSLASRFMRNERSNHTLQTTALVNEAYIRLVGKRGVDWKGRAHFLAVATQVMRHILVDYARGRLSEKRGGAAVPVSLDESLIISHDRLEGLVVLEDALKRLEAEDPRAMQVVVMRVFGGLTIDEIASVLGVSDRTVKREWKYGRSWLRAELGGDSP